MIPMLLLGCFVLTSLFAGPDGGTGAAAVFFLLFVLSIGGGSLIRVAIESFTALALGILAASTWRRGQNLRYCPPPVRQGRHPQWMASHLAEAPPAAPPPAAPPRRPAPTPYPRPRSTTAQRWAGDEPALFTHRDTPPTLVDFDQWGQR
jgi:hypothetical protein